nr:TPA: ATPase F0 subunit 8 [Cirrodrilus suzukii]
MPHLSPMPWMSMYFIVWSTMFFWKLPNIMYIGQHYPSIQNFYVKSHSTTYNSWNW